MNTNQISCFLEAVKENNFTKAASKLFVSQPNLSRSIAALEKELDIKLFIRHPDKSIALTQEGQLYYDCFSRYRNELTEIHKKCLLSKNIKKTIRIGYAIGWNLSDYLPDKLAQLSEKYPEINIELECHHIDKLAEKLEQHELDACLTMADPLIQSPGVHFQIICQLPKIIIYSNRYLKKASAGVTISDFYGKKLYLFQTSLVSTVQNELQTFFSPYGFCPEIKIVPNQETMVSAVENGLGIAVMDLWSQPVHSKYISWIPLPYTHTIAFAYAKDNSSPYIKDLCQLLKQTDLKNE